MRPTDTRAGDRDRIVTSMVVTSAGGGREIRWTVVIRGVGGRDVRVLVVSAVTVILLMGAVPLAVPGVPRLHGIPQLVALGVLVLAGVAFVVGLALLALGRSVRRRAAEQEEVVPTPVAPVAPAPAMAPAPLYVSVRTRS